MANSKSYGKYDFTAEKFDGDKIHLSDYAGKIVLVNFWAEWCEPCKAETPGFVKIYDQYHSRGLEIIGIAEESKPDLAKAFISQFGMKYIVARDDDGGIAEKFDLDVYPQSFLFGPKGDMVKAFRGFADESAVSAEINKLIAANY